MIMAQAQMAAAAASVGNHQDRLDEDDGRGGMHMDAHVPRTRARHDAIVDDDDDDTKHNDDDLSLIHI